MAQVPHDEAAWNEFVPGVMGRKIVNWCRERRLQDADVKDVSQVVLMKLAKRLRDFNYDPTRSFRGFLKKVVNDAIIDASRARGRLVGIGASDCFEVLTSTEAREDLVRRLEQEFDLELLEAATRLVRERALRPHTWEAYRLTTAEGFSGADAAARLGMQVAAVYVAKGTVIRMLQEEIRFLEALGTSVGTA